VEQELGMPQPQLIGLILQAVVVGFLRLHLLMMLLLMQIAVQAQLLLAQGLYV
jgi:hypothetical protein